jgi:selenide, water dikinase
MKLNSIGHKFGRIPGITAMTDVTGFGLLGHLSEICQGSNLSAVIEYDKIPRITEAEEYILQNCIPGGTGRNWESYGHQVRLKNDNWLQLLADPQTSGGLLIAVREDAIPEVEKIMADHQIQASPFGYLVEKSDMVIEVL